LATRESLVIYEKPKLAKPYLVIGFEGWPDAGQVSSGATGYLRDKLATSLLAEIKPDDFYLFQSAGAESRRPVVDIEKGLVSTLDLPATAFWFHKSKEAAHDLIISLGREPELRWHDYVNLVLELAQSFGVVRIYALGGTYDVVPHTMEPIISAVLSTPALEPEMKARGISLISYRGPSSIHTLLLTVAAARNIEAVSLWGYVPHYVQAPNTKVCYRLLNRLARMLGVSLSLEDMRRSSRELDEMVDKAVAQKPELQEYVRRLEVEYGKSKDEPGGPLPLKEDVIREIEDFLKKKGQE
jgi:proteasome assembly chaperone (PAC2) family protein